MRHCLQLLLHSLENDWVARGSRSTASAERTGMREHVRPSVTRAEEVVANASGENFPVALRVLPARHRRHLTNLYFFARLTDDLGDEVRPGGYGGAGSPPVSGGFPGGRPPGLAERKLRLRLLDELAADV